MQYFVELCFVFIFFSWDYRVLVVVSLAHSLSIVHFSSVFVYSDMKITGELIVEYR